MENYPQMQPKAWKGPGPCPDCETGKGRYHLHPLCDMLECPHCNMQAITCNEWLETLSKRMWPSASVLEDDDIRDSWFEQPWSCSECAAGPGEMHMDFCKFDDDCACCMFNVAGSASLLGADK